MQFRILRPILFAPYDDQIVLEKKGTVWNGELREQPNTQFLLNPNMASKIFPDKS